MATLAQGTTIGGIDVIEEIRKMRQVIDNDLLTHIRDKTNPHGVFAAQIGASAVNSEVGADSTSRLKNARKIGVNLASTTPANFDGTADIYTGVTGILATTNGGTGNNEGKAVSATKLATARTISLTGDVTGSASFDGSKNISISTTVAGANVDVPGTAVTFTSASNRQNIISGSTIKTLFGQIHKNFAELQEFAYTGNIQDLISFPLKYKNGIYMVGGSCITGSEGSGAPYMAGNHNFVYSYAATIMGGANFAANYRQAFRIKSRTTTEPYTITLDDTLYGFNTAFALLQVGQRLAYRCGCHVAYCAATTITAIDESTHTITVNGYGTNTAPRLNDFIINIDITSDVYAAEGYQYRPYMVSLSGESNTVLAAYASAENQENFVERNAEHAHAGGYSCTCTGEGAFTHGTYCSADTYSASFGYRCSSEESYTFTAGWYNKATKSGNCVLGYSCVGAGALGCLTCGRYNSNVDTTNDLFVVGNGSSAVSANAFRVCQTGVFAIGAVNSTGADYAEMFEWSDGNVNNEDRAGRFVTLDGDKIKFANADDFVLGVVSADPSVVGDVHDDQWNKMYLTDVFGRIIYEDILVPAETVEKPMKYENYHPGVDPETETKVIAPEHWERRPKLNPNYDSTQKYVSRSNRAEWDAVGMMGKLIIVDDGTPTINGWVKPSTDGIGTSSNTPTNFRVMKRLDDTHCQILILPGRN